MAKLIPLFFFCLYFSCCTLSAQSVYTTDGVELGDRQELISICVDGIGSEKVVEDGVTFSSKSICRCLIDEIITKISSDDLLQLAAVDEDADFMEMLTISHLTELMNCVSASANIDGQGVFPDGNDDLHEATVNLCVQAMGTPRQLAEAGVSPQQAHDFCSCAVDKMLNSGYNYDQLMNIEDENDVVFNEVMMQCIGELMDVSDLFSNSYHPQDIQGGGSSCSIPLLNFLNASRKVKLSICGVEKYFLFDTGASDLIISSDLADELWEQGCLSEANSLSTTEFELADGTSIDGFYVQLNHGTIGDYPVNNVVAAVIDDGGMLCGLGFLKKFKSWEIKDGNTLILYK